MKVFNIAFITPWPPLHTGIADYSYQLVKALNEFGHKIVVFTTTTKPLALGGVRIETVEPDWSGNDLSNFEKIVYQLGNNTTYHLWMISLIKNYPGLVQVHDLVMHHVVAWDTWCRGDTSSYLAKIEKWYGKDARDEIKKDLDNQNFPWDASKVIYYPLFEEYVQFASAVVVHSLFAYEKVKSAFPEKQVMLIKQSYNVLPDKRKRTEIYQIGVFGGVDRQKRLEWTLLALDLIGQKIVLNVVGSISDECKYLVDISNGLSNVIVKFHGRVNDIQFEEIMYSTDLCIALRFPSMGETSAIVAKTMGLGIPTIVNDIGWYSELPEEVVKVKLNDPINNLVDILKKYLSNKSDFMNWAIRCQKLATSLNNSYLYNARLFEQFLIEYPANTKLFERLIGIISSFCNAGKFKNTYSDMSNILDFVSESCNSFNPK